MLPEKVLQMQSAIEKEFETLESEALSVLTAVAHLAELDIWVDVRVAQVSELLDLDWATTERAAAFLEAEGLLTTSLRGMRVRAEGLRFLTSGRD